MGREQKSDLEKKLQYLHDKEIFKWDQRLLPSFILTEWNLQVLLIEAEAEREQLLDECYRLAEAFDSLNSEDKERYQALFSMMLSESFFTDSSCAIPSANAYMRAVSLLKDSYALRKKCEKKSKRFKISW